MSDTPGTHGAVGRREGGFTRLFDKRTTDFDAGSLQTLATQMIGNTGDDASNDPDGEENLAVPAGYTYFGQFVDHDLTFDTTSSLTDPNDGPTNLRTPRLDLDCVYGSGPDDQPYLYATEDAEGLFRGASLLLGEALPDSPGRHDLLRVGTGDGARAVIGDPRNDENSIVCNIQAAMIQFHNTVVAHLAAPPQALRGKALFVAARKLVRWTYQRIVVDGLPSACHRAGHVQHLPDSPDRNRRSRVPDVPAAATRWHAHRVRRRRLPFRALDGPYRLQAQ